MRLKLFLACFSTILFGTSIEGQNQWQKEFAAFDQQDQQQGVAIGQVLFIGSSTFTFWKDISSYFPGHVIENRGFGGSKMQDVLRNFDRLVKKYEPKQIIVYEGDNDLAAETSSVKEYLKDMACFVRLVKVTLPQSDLCIVSIKPSRYRGTNTIEKYREANNGLKMLCFENQITFINTWSCMWLSDGNINESLFGTDKLHLNEKGYTQWSRIIAPYLK
jgi:lysophospholipase L1-like esterase